MIPLEEKTAYDIGIELASRTKKRRKELHLTQNQLASKSGMSLGSYKRFEQTGQISLGSLINIAIALDCENEFDTLFAKRQYRSIDEVIADAKQSKK